MEKDQSEHEHRQDDQHKRRLSRIIPRAGDNKRRRKWFGKFSHGLTNLLERKLEVEEMGSADKVGC